VNTANVPDDATLGVVTTDIPAASMHPRTPSRLSLP
jgi:hypothetical protein